MSALEELQNLIAQLNDQDTDKVRVYVQGLLRERGRAESERWQFDFVAKFAQAKVSAPRGVSGMEVKMSDAACEGVVKRALWEHPPLTGAAMITYAVPIPKDLRALKLHFFTGIRDGSQLPPDRFIAFRIMVNDWKLWSAVKNTRDWEEYTLVMPELASDIARIEFQTDGLGDHRWNWAVWGEPKLIAD